MISLEFMYKSRTYYALVRTKIDRMEKKYVITIMNGALEKLLYGQHVIKEEAGELISDSNTTDERIAELKESIFDALQKRLSAGAVFS